MATDNLKKEEIYKGIQQAFRNLKEVDKEIGLKREKFASPNKLPGWTRHFDNFSIKICGNKLFVTYCSQLTVRELHELNLVNEVEGYIADIVKSLKSEFKEATDGKTLTLTKEKGDPKIWTEEVTYQRLTLYGTQVYTIGKIETLENDEESVLKQYRDNVTKALKALKLGPKEKNK